MVKVKVGCRRLAAGEPDAAAGVVLAISATRGAAETTGVELRTNRSSWQSPLGSGWPESTAASSAAAAGFGRARERGWSLKSSEARR